MSEIVLTKEKNLFALVKRIADKFSWDVNKSFPNGPPEGSLEKFDYKNSLDVIQFEIWLMELKNCKQEARIWYDELKEKPVGYQNDINQTIQVEGIQRIDERIRIQVETLQHIQSFISSPGKINITNQQLIEEFYKMASQLNDIAWEWALIEGAETVLFEKYKT